MESNALEAESREVYDGLVSSLEAAMAGEGQHYRSTECGPIEVNCFSICFWATLTGPAGMKQVYVKIPKVIFYDKEKETLGDLSADDITLAEDEYESLVYLSRHWDGADIGVTFVKPLGFFSEFNAIITERVMAEHLFRKYRRADLWRRLLGRIQADPVPDAMSRLGEALGRFHRRSGGPVVCHVDPILEKINGYMFELGEYGVDSAYLGKIARRLNRSKHLRLTSSRAVNLKGIDIRQVFVDGHSTLYILDPGKMNHGCREVDLARFVVTCRVLYWGSAAILFRLTPSSRYEESFLTAYAQANGASETALGILIVKELFKHWRMAHVSLEKRRWPRFYKVLLKKVYVDPFFKKQVSIALSKWETVGGLRTGH
jgi:hypothetical protein